MNRSTVSVVRVAAVECLSQILQCCEHVHEYESQLIDDVIVPCLFQVFREADAAVRVAGVKLIHCACKQAIVTGQSALLLHHLEHVILKAIHGDAQVFGLLL